MAIPKNLTVTRCIDDLERPADSKVEGKYDGAFIQQATRNPSAWVGDRFTLYIPVLGELDSEGGQKYDRIEMEGATVTVYDEAVHVAGFVHVKPDGSPVRFVQDDHTGVYRREWWTQRGMR